MSQQRSPHEDMILAVIVVFLTFSFFYFIWYFFHEELTEVLRWIRLGQLWLVQLFFGQDTPMPVTYPGVAPQSTETWREFLRHADIKAGQIGWPEIRVSTEIAVYPLRTFFAVLLGLMALIIMFKGPGTKYRRRMNLEQLMAEQSKTFRTIKPFLRFDPRDALNRAPGNPVPANLPLFAEALSPEEWVAHNDVSYVGNKLDFAEAARAFAKQLGPRWEGPKKLPLYAQGLYAAFALKHVRKRKDSDEMLNQMAECWTPDHGFRPTGKLLSQIRRVIKDPKIGGALQKYADQHAYQTTAMLRCLSRAREEGGVLAPATFVWLRATDRALWYPLNNLGRKAYHTEAAGAMVHYTNELIAGQKIPTPRFDEVVRNLETFLKGPQARPIPDRDEKYKPTAFWKKKKKKKK